MKKSKESKAEKTKTEKTKIVVGLSDGVDSSVALLFLKKPSAEWV